MALTEKKRQQILNDPRFKNIISDFKTESVETTTLTPAEQVKARQQRVSAIETPEVTAVEEQEGAEGLKGVAVGVGKGVASTLRGASELGEKGIKGLGRFLTPKKFEERLGFAKTEEPVIEQFIPEEKVKPVGTAEKIGFFGEQIGEFLIPGAAPTKIGKAAAGAKALKEAPKAAKTAARIIGTGAGEAVLATGQTAIQKGGFDEEAKEAGIIGAVTPGAFEAIGKIAKPLFKGIGKVTAGVTGRVTGTQGDVLIEAFKNPKVIKAARVAGKDIASFQDELLENTKTGLSRLKELRASKYKPQLEAIKLDKTKLDDIVDQAGTVTREALDSARIKVNPDLTLDFSESSIINGQNVIEKAVKDILDWDDTTAIGLDTLKRRLYSFGEQLPREAKPAKNIVDGIAGSVRSGLLDNVSGYREMVGDYEKMSSLIDEINSAFSLGGKNKETAIKRVMSALRENNETRKELLEVLGERAGQDIVADVAGVQIAPLTSRGLAGVVSPGLGGLAAVVSPSALPGILTYFAVSSPRLVGELTNILGRVTDKMIEANKFSPQIQRELRELIIKAQEEEEK